MSEDNARGQNPYIGYGVTMFKLFCQHFGNIEQKRKRETRKKEEKLIVVLEGLKNEKGFELRLMVMGVCDHEEKT